MCVYDTGDFSKKYFTGYFKGKNTLLDLLYIYIYIYSCLHVYIYILLIVTRP